MARSSGGIPDYDYIFKLVLVGDSSVGKSNLLLRFTRNEFRLDTQSTIGVEFAYKQLIIDGKKIKTQVWDTAGQERFKTVVPQFYRGSEGALVVFDLTKPDSFSHVPVWVEEAHRHAPTDIPILLVGNKSDLVDQRKVTLEQARALAQQLNVSYIETSALNASNVEKAFVLLVTTIYEKKMPKSVDSASSSTTTIKSPPAAKFVDHSRVPTIPVTSETTITLNTPARPTQNSKPNESSKKDGCCVIS